MLESLFNKVPEEMKTCNFIKKRLKRKCFPVKFAKNFAEHPFYRSSLLAASEA